jgi:hypothetical protein
MSSNIFEPFVGNFKKNQEKDMLIDSMLKLIE